MPYLYFLIPVLVVFLVVVLSFMIYYILKNSQQTTGNKTDFPGIPDMSGLSHKEFMRKSEEIVEFSKSGETVVYDCLVLLREIFPTVIEIEVFYLKFISKQVRRFDVSMFIEFMRVLISSAPPDIDKEKVETVSAINTRMFYVLWSSAFPESGRKLFQDLEKEIIFGRIVDMAKNKEKNEEDSLD